MTQSKRITITCDEGRIILEALQNQLWTYDTIKQQHIGIEDSEIDRQKAEVEQVYQTIKQKLKKH